MVSATAAAATTKDNNKVPTDISVSKATAVTADSSSHDDDKSLGETAHLKQPPTTTTTTTDDDDDYDDQVNSGDDDADDGSGISGAAVGGGDIADFMPDFTQPLRIQTSKMTGMEARLMGSSNSSSNNNSGSNTHLHIREGLQQHLKRRKSDSANLSSRSGSESPRGNRGGSHSGCNYDGGSSISSLEEQGFDTDILTDKMGVLELDWKTQQEISQSLNRSLSNLPVVAERLTDDMLEDCYAFNDVRGREGTLSRGGSITTGGEVSSNFLEPLEEMDGEDDNDEGEKIKITNLAEILEADEEDWGETTTGPPTLTST
jgi:hypothetical protein